jgi:hypothetical protein
MAHDPDGPMPDQPGINGVQYAASTGYLYYTNTAQDLFMSVRVDPKTHDPAGEPEFVAGGMMGDDFCLDENAGVAHIATLTGRAPVTHSRGREGNAGQTRTPVKQRVLKLG